MSNSTGTPPPSSSPQEPRLADEPFNDTAADVILRTSDQVNFYVCRYILSLASPFFRDMFSLPQPERAAEKYIGEDPTASHPVIDVSEDSRTLDFVLRFCYPMRKPIMTELKDVAPVLLSACKYDMDAVLDVAKIALEQCIEQDTPGVFALACRCELYDVCSKAAEEFVQRPFLSLESKELDHITALQYHRLLEYHQRYAKGDSRVMPPEAWSKSQLSVEQQPLSPASSITPPSGSLRPSLVPPREAGTPFDDKNTDVVLRSSDQVAFRVHSFILSLASPVFKGMILDHQQVLTSETRPAGDEAKLPLIIDVSEDSDTLNVLLRCCYPVRLPRLTQLSDARLVLAAGLKYDVDAVKAFAEAALMEFVDEDILGVWSIALRYKLRDACTAAARRFLQHPMISLYSADLSYTSARHYDELLRYHKHCGEAASAVSSSKTWFSEDMSDFVRQSPGCRYCWTENTSGGSHWFAPSSLWTFLTAAKGALEVRPCGLAVLSDEVWSKWPRYQRSCYTCGRSYALEIIFAQAFANEVDRVVAEVELPNFF